MGNLVTSIKEELNIHKEIRVISFDIFDTLLFRMVRKPDAVFDIVGRKAVELGVLPKHITPVVYRNLRKEAEKKARDKKKISDGSEEVFLNDILSYLPVQEITVEQLVKLEMKTEKEVCYLNPDIPEVFQYLQDEKKYKIILTSDMYFSKKQIQEILEANEVSLELFDDIHVSSEIGKNKKSGELYQYLLEQYQCRPEEMVHIGDNYMSDVVNAQFLGIHTVYYDVISSEKCMNLQMEELKYGILSSELYALRRYISGKADDFDAEQRSWFRIGAMIFGPLMSGVAEWVLDTAERESVTNIYPLMREGWILSQLLQQAAKYREKEFHIEPMYISRRAVFVPGLGKWDEEAFERLIEIKQGTVGTVLNLFQLEEGSLQEYRDCLLTDLQNVKIEDKTCKKLLKECLFAPENVIHIEKVIQDAKRNLQNYLCGLGTEEDFITIDLGMRGTMQKVLSEICQSEDEKKKRIHLLIFGAYETLQKVMEGIDIRGYAGYAGDFEELVSEVVQRPHIWEQLMMCEEGTTIGYTEDAKPVTKQIENMNGRQFQWISWCQKGMLAFQKEYLEMKQKKHGMCLKILPQDAARIALRMITLPTLEEAKLLGTLQFDENYGVDGVYPLCTSELILEAKRTGIEVFAESHPPGEIAWIEGIVTQVDASYYLNQILEQAKSGYERSIVKIVQRVLEERPERVVVAGAGEAGRMLQRYLELYGIGIEAFTDQNVKLQGSGLNGIPVKTLKDTFDTNHFVIASFAYADEIAVQIRELKGNDVMIYRY